MRTLPRRRLTVELLEQRTAPAVFAVTTFEDTIEAVRDGSGLDADGNVSLRSAIMAANDLGGAHTIQLSEGTFALSRAPEGGNDDASGDLNVGRGQTRVELTIEGYWADWTVIDAGYLDQGLEVGFFATATLTNLTVANGLGGFGGAIANAGQLTLSNVALRNSYASHGAGLLNQGTATLTDVLVEGNSANQGGGIHNGGTMTATTTTVSYNYAGQGGGIFNAGTLTLTRSTIHDNYTHETVGQGGGIFNQASLSATNVTIAQNWATNGGGLTIVGFGTSTFTNCTIAANVAWGNPSSAGGGIVVGNGTPPVRLKNTLVALNWSERAPDISGPITSLGTNLISDGTGGTGFAATDLVGSTNAPLDPLLGPLQDNGGPTLTMALQAGSAAIDAGDADGAPAIDQRGQLRDGFIDIGAFEFLEE